MSESQYARGLDIRRKVLGDSHVDRAQSEITDFDREFQRLISEFAWGTVWSGDGLDRKTRHMVTIAILAALGKEHELGMHLRATQNTGVSRVEIREVFHQVAVYAGIPAANRAFTIGKEVFEGSGGSPYGGSPKEEDN
jgi:4-carboxymuconolactone decarboxylase